MSPNKFTDLTMLLKKFWEYGHLQKYIGFNTDKIKFKLSPWYFSEYNTNKNDNFFYLIFKDKKETISVKLSEFNSFEEFMKYVVTTIVKYEPNLIEDLPKELEKQISK